MRAWITTLVWYILIIGEYNRAKSEYSKAISHDSLFILNPDAYARILDHMAMTNLRLGETASVEDDLTRALLYPGQYRGPGGSFA